jgi:hypothetical protein
MEIDQEIQAAKTLNLNQNVNLMLENKSPYG